MQIFFWDQVSSQEPSVRVHGTTGALPAGTSSACTVQLHLSLWSEQKPLSSDEIFVKENLFCYQTFDILQNSISKVVTERILIQCTRGSLCVRRRTSLLLKCSRLLSEQPCTAGWEMLG